MAGVAVVTDTTHYLPRELVERHALHQVSLYVNWQGRTDRELDFADYDDYYGHLVQTEDLPTTSAHGRPAFAADAAASATSPRPPHAVSES